MFRVSADWKRAYPGAHAGILAMRNVINPSRHPELDQQKEELETDLRTLFKEPDSLKSLGPIKAYQAYFKRFKKTYHVFQQLESVIFKGKPIPQVAALVEAMFMEELRNTLLTAGHDLDVVKTPLKLDTAKGNEKYIRMNGQEQVLKAGDMMIADSVGCDFQRDLWPRQAYDDHRGHQKSLVYCLRCSRYWCASGAATPGRDCG